MSSSLVIDVMAVRRAWPFWTAATLGIIGGGLIAGFLAHTPSRSAMWLVAYLVLVVGTAQAALAAGQAWLAPSAPTAGWLASEWLLFNAANVLVIAGVLRGHGAWVNVGALLLAAALALFLRGVRGGAGGWLAGAYRGLVVLLGCSALIGVGLMALHRHHADAPAVGDQRAEHR